MKGVKFWNGSMIFIKMTLRGRVFLDVIAWAHYFLNISRYNTIWEVFKTTNTIMWRYSIESTKWHIMCIYIGLFMGLYDEYTWNYNLNLDISTIQVKLFFRITMDLIYLELYPQEGDNVQMLYYKKINRLCQYRNIINILEIK